MFSSLLLVSLAVPVFFLAPKYFNPLSWVHTRYMEQIQPEFPKADVLIIGGSHAGLSAALTLYRHQHSIIVLDNKQPRNRWDSPTHALSGWENQKASKYRAHSRAELLRTGFVQFIDEEVTSLERMNDSWFEVRTTAHRRLAGRKILLAMGTNFAFPSIPGYVDFFPRRIFHCLFTFGFEHRGSQHAGILAMGHAGSPIHTAMLVQDAEKFADQITVYTNGNGALETSIRNEMHSMSTARNTTRYDNRRVIGFTKSEELDERMLMEFEDGNSDTLDFLVHQPDTMVHAGFVKQLGLELNERGDIVTQVPFYQTTVEGVFAAGDCASPFKIISNALLMGANAGAGLARQLPRNVTGNTIN